MPFSRTARTTPSSMRARKLEPQLPPPVGDRFALAGRVWEVEELDLARKLIYVHSVAGKMQVEWPGDYGEIHTKILEMMRKVLADDREYPYLKPNAAERLAAARRVFASAGMKEHMLVSLGGNTKCLFPWLGTRSFRTLRKYLQKNAALFGITASNTTAAIISPSRATVRRKSFSPC